MISTWVLLLLSVGYVMLLFAIAYWGDRDKRRAVFRRSLVYSLTLAVYCTSWTFYGAVGTATQNGWGYLPIYLGPILVIFFGWPVIRRIVAVSKRQNLTSIADFIAARYGKAQSLAVLVTIIATIGSVPYIALQLKAVVGAFGIVSDYGLTVDAASGVADYGTALFVAAALAIFAILFGTRKIDVTEHHEGMMLAIAFESVVKLLAFIAVGLFALFLVGDSGDAGKLQQAASPFAFDHWPDTFVTQLVLASAAIFCLPRQFHVAVVEAHEDADIRSSRWIFPLYLLVFSAFVVPITLAGLQALPVGVYSGDAFVLALPMQAGYDTLTVLAFLGGFSAATGMVIVSCVALSTMISNEVVMPSLLRIKALGLSEKKDLSRLLIHIRRGSIVAILAFAYLYYLATDESAALASIGLLSFAAAAQVAPLILFGLYWPRSTRSGAIAGLATGFAIWTYTLFLPNLARSGLFDTGFIDQGLFSLSWLRPEALLVDLQAPPLTHGVTWSLLANISVLVGVSLATRQSLVEKIQARAFNSPVQSRRRTRSVGTGGEITNADLRTLAERFLGEAQATRSLAEFAEAEGVDIAPAAAADRRLLQFTERLLSGAIGAASARVVMTTALQRTGMAIGDVVLLLDETSQAIRFNRQLLEATLENITQGVSVADASQRLIGWNSRYIELFAYPTGMVHVGKPVAELIRYNLELGRFGEKHVEQEIAKRLRFMQSGSSYHYQSAFFDGKVIEIRGQPMREGGYVTTYTDITDFKAAENALVEAKQLLEQRVADRTAELEDAMLARRRAKADAEDANASKTRFLAAAAHDLLQPLNAAKLFAALLNEHRDEMAAEQGDLVERVESGLTAVEDLLSAILDISRLDTAAPVPSPEVIPVNELFDALKIQFAQTFADEGLELRFAESDLHVRSDRALLRRILQNFVSNARRYTREGGVLVGCRRQGQSVALQVIDTGIGIAAEDRQRIFEEFHRLSGGDKQTKRGLGLGLAIVDRIARLLDHPVELRSEPGKGSCFEVHVPRAAKPQDKPAVTPQSEPRQRTTLAGQVIVCVDNEPEILDAMERLLGKWGARPLTAGHCDEAVAKVLRLREDESLEPAILLVDYHLDDDATGLEVVAAVREALGHDVPTVVLTADHSDAVAADIGEAGHPILHKPVKPAALRALVNRLLSRRDVA